LGDAGQGPGACHSCPKRERKHFFSEEKKQKTFVPASAPKYRAMTLGMGSGEEIKVFCFFSSEKKTFL
jgi:hypothetical protein